MKNEYELCSKEDVLNKYKELELFFTSSLKRIDDLKSNNPSTRELLEKFKAKLKEIINECEEEIHIAENKIVWDRLVIAFFGETNAGKSTIIDTFRILYDRNRVPNSDGLIVGDGSLDFTKNYSKYDLSIAGKPFTLIDVPGIEGKESDFKTDIIDALGRAHCVFYVNGHNKKPDSATTSKIKKYLGEWIEVYSIQNIRGDASTYDEEDERVCLITEGVQKIEKEVSASFQQILDAAYKGNLQVQALLAMCAKASFSAERKSLQKAQDKLLRFFESSDNLFAFSNFKSLTDLVKEKSNNFTSEIIKANNKKINSLSNSAKNKINGLYKKEEDNISTINQQLHSFEKDTKQIFAEVLKDIKVKVKNCIRENVNKLKIYLNEVIDDFHDDHNLCKDKMDDIAETFEKEIKKSIKTIFRVEFDKIKENIDHKKKQIEGIKINYIPKLDCNVSIDCDFSISTDELDFNLDDMGDYAETAAKGAGLGAVVGSIIPGLGTLIGASVGAAIGAGGRLLKKNLWDDKDTKKISSAKNLLSQQIDVIEVEINEKIELEINNISENINCEKEKIRKIIQKENDNLNQLNKLVNDIQESMNKMMMINDDNLGL